MSSPPSNACYKCRPPGVCMSFVSWQYCCVKCVGFGFGAFCCECFVCVVSETVQFEQDYDDLLDVRLSQWF
jgi:hypothetical protein